MSRNHMEVCHLWASGNKADAKGFNIYFEGREIFSYGSHFLLGFRMGPSLFFLNSSGYSISTSKHKSYVWRAAHGEIFHVPNLTAYRHELRTLARFREGKADKADARRAGARMIAALAPMIGEGGAWKAETVSRDAVERLAMESGFTAKQAASAIDKAAGAAARKAEADAKRAAAGERAEAIAAAKVAPAEWQARLAAHVAAIREAAESARIANERKAAEIAAWRAGGPRVYFDSDHGGAAIRATGVERDASGEIIGGTLETSHGASVPLAHAIRVFRFLKLMRERGEGWQRNGRTIRVGHYAVDSVRPDGGFTAGCHRFAWPEIETLALALGVFDVAPADVREPSQAAA